MLSVSEKDDNILNLSIKLTQGSRLEYLLPTSAEKEINRLKYHFDELVLS
jgi:hypothetical protein